MDTLLEARIRIEANIPTNANSDAIFEERCEQAQDEFNRIEQLILSLYGPGGQFHIPGLIVSIEQS